MTTAYIAIGVFILISALVVGAMRFGKYKEQKKQSDQIAKDRGRDADINSKPFISRPFSRMRSKK